MEDILSSIKRIIAEDSEAALSGPRTKRSVAPLRTERALAPAGGDNEQDDVLELTNPVVVEQSEPVAMTPSPPPADAAPVAKAAARPEPAPKPAMASPSTVEASRTSLAALSALVVKPAVTGGDTLEGLVREMLKPMIAQWLDARLPDIVERQVAIEVRRISERG